MNSIILLNVFLFLLLPEEVSIAQQLDEIDSLSLQLEMTDNGQEKVDLLLMLSDNYKDNDPAQALSYAKEAHLIADKTNYKKGIVSSLVRQAEYQRGLTNFEKAMELAITSLNRSRKEELTEQMAEASYVIGSIYNDLGNYDNGSDYYFNCLKLYEQINDQSGIAKALNGIGAIYFEQKNYDKALEYFFDALRLSEQISNEDGIARGLNNVAVVFQDRGEHKKALPYFHKAIDLNRKLNYRRGEAINYLNLGISLQKLKAYDTALMNFQYSMAILKDLNYNVLVATCHIYLGKYFFEVNEPRRALQHLISAYKIGKDLNSQKLVYESVQELHQYHLRRGDTANAYKYAILEYQSKDSLNIEETRTEVSRLELQYAFDKKEKVREIARQRKDFMVLLVILGLVFIIIIVLLIYARNRLKARAGKIEKQWLSDELEHRNKELTSNVLQLMRKNELITSLSNKLIKIEKEAVRDETKAAIYQIARELKKASNDQLLEEFETRFKQVHSEFYEKLMQRYPSLSPQEQRLCAFLRLNMSTKEIANLTGQRIRSLEIARSRLRKKLGISGSEINLVTFLSKI